MRALIVCLTLAAGAAGAAPDLPIPGAPVAEDRTEAGRVPMPVDAVSDPAEVASVEGQVTRRAWRRTQGSRTPLQLIAPLRDVLEDAGYEVVFDCVDRACGGFDFRYALDLLPAPEMMVDLSAFHYLAARDGDAWVQIVTSRTAAAGFIHVTTVDPLTGSDRIPAPQRTDGATDAPAPEVTSPPPATGVEDGDVIAVLTSRGSTRLSDVAFDSGSARLLDGPAPSLDALAGFLQGSPDSRVLLVGHTDAVGSLASNQALSLRRAEAVVARLRELGVPARQLEAAGAGYLAPLAPSTTEEGRALNRRVEAVLLDTQ